MRAYKGRYLDKSSFFHLPSGALYDDYDGSVRRVGNIGRDGSINVRNKYRIKYGQRLRQIVDFDKGREVPA